VHVSVLELRDGALINARVDDELWTNAHVPLAELPASERGWLAKVARRAIAAIVGADQPTMCFESDGARARVHVGGVVHDVALEPAHADLAILLEAVRGALLIDEDARGLNKKAAGDSPA
jgi:hypothetical protein